MIHRFVVLLLVLAWGGGVARGEDAKDPDAFAKEHLDGASGDRALKLVKELSADGMKGRTTGAAGGEAVENWMLNKMAEFGLHPADAGGTYLEPFAFVAGGRRAKGHNALGAIKGRDADLVHEIILVTAAMDGPGLGPDGKPLPGSEATAVGAGLMIHLADVLTGNRLRPKRTIIFCGFGASEANHAGSQALAARYPFQGEVVAVLNLGDVGQGKRVLVSGGGLFPRVQTLLSAALTPASHGTFAFRGRTDARGGESPFEDRGVPAFSLATAGRRSGIAAPCLEVAAQVAGRLLLKLAMHPQSLRDPRGSAEYLVRRGPRYTLRSTEQGAHCVLAPQGGASPAPRPPGPKAIETKFAGVLWPVDGSESAMKAWRAMSRTAASGDSVNVLIRRPADAMAAWRAHRLGIIGYGGCQGTVTQRLALLEAYAQSGARFVAPWYLTSAADRTPATVKRLAAACKRLRLIPDVGVLGPEGWKLARTTLGDSPACASMSVQALAKAGVGLAAMGPQTLVFACGPVAETLGPALRPGAPATLILAAFTEPGLEVLHAWGAKQPEGWALPGSPQRARVRAVLGGNLVAWLAKAEKK